MKKTQTIDLTKMSELLLDEETASFQPDWDNILLMTAYDTDRTFVLTWDGRHLVLPRPLREVLEQFARDNDIAEFECQALYDMIDVHKGRGYIAGHNRLVPTCGTSNDGVVYYVAKRLGDKRATDDGCTMASFWGRKRRIFRVKIDTSYQTFINLLQAADDAANLQLDTLEWRMHSLGVQKVDKQREGVRFYNMCSNRRAMSRDLRRRWMMMLVRRVIRNYCTEEECEEIERLIRHYIEK